jgi:type 1 glutamine amidotransferase
VRRARLRRSGVLAGVVALAVAAVSSGAGSAETGTRILVFSKTAGFRHDSIALAVETLRKLGPRNGVAVDATEDASAFTDANLSRYAAVVFLLTTGDVLDDKQQAAFERYIRAGGGYAGVHSAADTEYQWPFYGALVGAYFKSHPAIQPAVCRIADVRDPSTAGLPRRWQRTDEWYNFARNPRGPVSVLATVDEGTYAPGPDAMGADHPVAWKHAFRGGRAWYTAMGHTSESYADAAFQKHLLGGIRYAAGLTPPRILGIRAVAAARRIHVTLRYATCTPCAGALRVAGRLTVLHLRAGAGMGQSPPLRPGRYTAIVVVRDPLSGVTRSATRTVRVP